MQFPLAILALLSLASASLVKVLIFNSDGSKRGFLGITLNGYGYVADSPTIYDFDSNNMLVYTPSLKFTLSMFNNFDIVLQTTFGPTGTPLSLLKAPTKGPQYMIQNTPFYASTGTKYTLGVAGYAVIGQVGNTPPSGSRIYLVMEYLSPISSSTTSSTTSSSTGWSNTTVTITSQTTSYTTYCPLPTVITITTCGTDNCYPVPVTVTTATTITCAACVVPVTVAAPITTLAVDTATAQPAPAPAPATTVSIAPVANAAAKHAAGFVGAAAVAAALL